MAVKWTQPMIDKAKALRNAGFSVKKIVNELNASIGRHGVVTPSAVAHLFRRMHFQTDREGHRKLETRRKVPVTCLVSGCERSPVVGRMCAEHAASNKPEAVLPSSFIRPPTLKQLMGGR